MKRNIVLMLMATIAISQYCNSFILSGNYYDINVGQQSDQSVTVPEVSTSASVTFNLCTNVSKVCEVITPILNSVNQVQYHQGYAILTVNSSFCIPFDDYPSASMQNQSDENGGVQVQYTSPTIAGQAYTMTLMSYCGTSQSNQYNSTNYLINSGLDGCPKLELTTLWDFFSRNTLAFFIVTEILGIILMVLGIYLYRITLMLLGTLAAFFIFVMVESLLVFQPGVPNDLITSVIVITIITSVLVGYVTLYFPKVGLFVMGMWVGFFLSFILNNIALYHISANPPALPLMITMGILGIGMGVLNLFIKKIFVIISTSFIGAYASIRALSWYLGKYPNEFLIAQQVHTQSTATKVQWQYYIYVVALVILTSSSIAVQFWIFRKKSKMLGKKADLDQYLNKIEEDLDLQRSKFIQLDNVFKKQEKRQKPRYLKKQRRSEDEEEGESQSNKSEEEEQKPRNYRNSKKNAQKPGKGRKSESEQQQSQHSDEQGEDQDESSKHSPGRQSNRNSQQESLQQRLLNNKRR